MSAAIITAMRTCMTLLEKADRLPIRHATRIMRSPPNQTMATVERFMIPNRNGIIVAKRRLTRSEVSVRSRLRRRSAPRRARCARSADDADAAQTISRMTC